MIMIGFDAFAGPSWLYAGGDDFLRAISVSLRTGNSHRYYGLRFERSRQRVQMLCAGTSAVDLDFL